MDRKYENGADSSSIRFFVGKELEKTPVYGSLTLFIVGNEPNEEINKRLDRINNDPKRDKITHLYFAANHSYNKFTQFEQLSHYLNLGYDVTYENTAEGIQKVRDSLITEIPEGRKFILMVSVVIPKVMDLPENTSIILKIDDKDTDRTNPGVWCVAPHFGSGYTDFTEYSGDEILE